jgi:hypothetical protein
MPRKTSSKPSSSGEKNDAARSSRIASRKKSAKKKTASGKRAQQSAADTSGVYVSEDQVAERAKAIWYARGCPVGFDEQNWHQARVQLEAEAQRA